ncbi:MAG: signal recognition particle-docking protein FtsY [Nanoarchaeota archaeon]|nr:signal recognition particle-docking protein FtsY [Patescibacteria group bacterium]MBU4070384.1 signal recognition particle-docking protein FtsY [Nanoarchaeota archaeon]
MFGKLKDKLKSWTKKLSERKQEVEEISQKEKPEEIKKIPKKSELAEKIKKPELSKEIKLPTEFNVGLQKYEPDIEKLKEKAKELEIKEHPKPGEKGFFSKITSKINKIKISEKEFDVYAEELEMLLLENNVALEVAEKIIKELREKIVGKELLKKEIEGEITEYFKEIIREILIMPFNIIEKIKEKQEKPYVILFCGINGSGKTTTIAKIAASLKNKNVSCVLAAADTFRAASIEQIKTHGEKIGVKVISNEYGSDPASVGFDAIKYAKKNRLDCVLIDTAGRMHTSKNLLKEIGKISRVCKPDTKIFIGESITGNDAIEQVKSFDWEIGIDGIILTKADIDEKGGTALSVGYVTKKPILYLGTGQEYDKIEVFDKNKFIEKLGL